METLSIDILNPPSKVLLKDSKT